jgi:hypothetical protein
VVYFIIFKNLSKKTTKEIGWSLPRQQARLHCYALWFNLE